MLPIIAVVFPLSVTFVSKYCTSVHRSVLLKPNVSKVASEMHELVAPVAAKSGMLWRGAEQPGIFARRKRSGP